VARRIKPSLDEDSLAALGARRLARLVIDHARDDPSLRDKLDALLPNANDAPDLPEEPSSRLTRSLERRIPSCIGPRDTSPRLPFSQTKGVKMAEFYFATIRLPDRFRGPVLLRDSQLFF
jgi:hypothetical protein